MVGNKYSAFLLLILSHYNFFEKGITTLSNVIYANFNHSSSVTNIDSTDKGNNLKEFHNVLDGKQFYKKNVKRVTFSKLDPCQQYGWEENINFNRSIGQNVINSSSHNYNEERNDNLTGEIVNPGYHDQYPNNMECVNIIVAPKNYVISLSFDVKTFEIEPSSNCQFDFLEMRDGPFGWSPLIGKFCGLKHPNLFQWKSMGRYVWMYFKTDKELRYKGFRLLYKFVIARDTHKKLNISRQDNYVQSKEKKHETSHFKLNEAMECIKILPAKKYDHIKISDISTNSKTLSKLLDIAIDCVWIIEYPPLSNVFLRLPHKNLLGSLDCRIAALELYSAASSLNNRFVKICQAQDPHLKSSTYNTDFAHDTYDNNKDNTSWFNKNDEDSWVSCSKFLTKRRPVKLFVRLQISSYPSFLTLLRAKGSNTSNKFRSNSLECVEATANGRKSSSKTCENTDYNNIEDTITLFEYTLFTTNVKCRVDSQFDCGNNTCVDKTFICDGVVNCPNFSDEHNCHAKRFTSRDLGNFSNFLGTWFGDKLNASIVLLILASSVIILGGAYVAYKLSECQPLTFGNGKLWNLYYAKRGNLSTKSNSGLSEHTTYSFNDLTPKVERVNLDIDSMTAEPNNFLESASLASFDFKKLNGGHNINVKYQDNIRVIYGENLSQNNDRKMIGQVEETNRLYYVKEATKIKPFQHKRMTPEGNTQILQNDSQRGSKDLNLNVIPIYMTGTTRSNHDFARKDAKNIWHYHNTDANQSLNNDRMGNRNILMNLKSILL
ncbi:unnamed protein product [Gordionus sp. m RMFG-2023]